MTGDHFVDSTAGPSPATGTYRIVGICGRGRQEIIAERLLPESAEKIRNWLIRDGRFPEVLVELESDPAVVSQGLTTDRA